MAQVDNFHLSHIILSDSYFGLFAHLSVNSLLVCQSVCRLKIVFFLRKYMKMKVFINIQLNFMIVSQLVINVHFWFFFRNCQRRIFKKLTLVLVFFFLFTFFPPFSSQFIQKGIQDKHVPAFFLSLFLFFSFVFFFSSLSLFTSSSSSFSF